MQSFRFHPAVARWFEAEFGSPTEPQALGWPAIQSGRHTLISAPTGSGKTLAAFLASLDMLFGKVRKEICRGNGSRLCVAAQSAEQTTFAKISRNRLLNSRDAAENGGRRD